jgi:regulator of RNase E activity RraA
MSTTIERGFMQGTTDRDSERFELVARELYTAVLGDVMDTLGRVHQFLPAGIRPLLPTMKVVGRAMPVLISDVFGTSAKPFGRLTEALDSLSPGDVYLARRGRAECAGWGELLTAAARARGARGAIIDGYHRDTDRVLDQDFPVFSRGGYGQDAGVRAHVLDYGVTVEIDGVVVQPGDLVVGDRDGVLVIPAEIEDEVVERALTKASAENVVRQAIEGGMSTTEAFATYGVL